MHGSHPTGCDRISAPAASISMPRLTSRGTWDQRVVAEECPVALVFDGTTLAVLMATPSALRNTMQQLDDIEIAETTRLWDQYCGNDSRVEAVAIERNDALAARRDEVDDRPHAMSDAR